MGLYIFWLTLIRACLNWLIFWIGIKRDLGGPDGTVNSGLRRETGLCDPYNQSERFLATVPPVVLAESACAETLSVGERERERDLWKKRKETCNSKTESFCTFFFFSFLSVDYRNCPQWILFGYRPLILLSFCWLWPLMLGSERSRVRVWMLMYSLFWVRWILFCFVRGAVLLVDTTKKKIHVGNVGGCQYNSRGVFWLLKFRWKNGRRTVEFGLFHEQCV